MNRHNKSLPSLSNLRIEEECSPDTALKNAIFIAFPGKLAVYFDKEDKDNTDQ